MKPGMRIAPVAALALLVVVLLGAALSLFTVGQTQQALVTQFGRPVRVITVPGLHVRIPFVQSISTFDRRLMNMEMPGEEVILGDQRRLIVDSFTMFRITNPLLFYQTVGPIEQNIRFRLGAVMSSSLRRVLGNDTLVAVLSADRNRIMGTIRDQVNQEMKSFGVAVEDVRIRRADLPEENTQAILKRMQSERQRVAAQLRAEGAEASARIRADAERDRTVLLADARARADQLRGEGEQQAIATYAAAYGRDPQFFSVWRTLQAYRSAFDSGKTSLLLGQDAEFLRYLRKVPQADQMPQAGRVPQAGQAPAAEAPAH